MYRATPYVDPVVKGRVEGPAPNITVQTITHRFLDMQAEIKTGSRQSMRVSWHQDLKVRLSLCPTSWLMLTLNLV